MNKTTTGLAIGAGVLVLGLALAACDIPRLPANVWPKNFSVSAGHHPNVNNLLVTDLQINSATNALEGDWQSNAEPTGSPMPTYPVKGCVEATANFDQLGLPDAYETIVGCPTVVDAEQLWAHIGFSHMTRGGWAAAGGFGQYGNQSKSYVLNYQSSDFEPCWAFATISRVNNVTAVTGFCDYQDNGLPADAQEAQAWAAMAVSRIQALDKPVTNKVG